MRPPRLPWRWQCSIGLVVVVLVAATLASWRHLVADDPPADNPAAPAGASLEDQVELTVPSTLRVAGKHAYFIKITLTSTSEDPVKGPLYLVAEGTGIEGLTLIDADGTTADDEPFLLLLPLNRALAPESDSLSRTLKFRSGQTLPSDQKRQFKLQYRLTRNVTVPKSAERKRGSGKGFGRPARGGRASDARSGREEGAKADRSDQKDRSSGGDDEDGSGQQNQQDEARAPYTLKPGITKEKIARVMKIQDANTKKLLKTEGVEGTATAVDEDGDLVIRVYTQRHGIRNNLPGQIEGVTVEAKVTGTVRPYFQPPQDKRGQAGMPKPLPVVPDPQQRFPRPVPMGVSGIVESFFCATGTIGSRLKGADGTLYALSNNHVFADENNASIGDNILQPGPLDNNCAIDPADSIGTLEAFVPISFGFFSENHVDAAVARVTAATFSNSTVPEAYGRVNEHTVPPVLGVKVQKMGRTTSHTTGRITAINVNILVGYSSGVAAFVEQVEVVNPIIRLNPITGTSTVSLIPFGAPGDSGSLIVTRDGRNPVALLFAGGGPFVFGNPIDTVLEELSNEVGQELKFDGDPSNAVPP